MNLSHGKHRLRYVTMGFQVDLPDGLNLQLFFGVLFSNLSYCIELRYGRKLFPVAVGVAARCRTPSSHYAGAHCTIKAKL